MNQGEIPKKVHPMKETSDEYHPLFEDLRELNWDILRRKQPWKMGADLRLEPEYTDKEQKMLRDCWDLPMSLPVTKKEGTPDKFFKDLDWNNLTDSDKEGVLSRIESIKVRTINYSKPIAIVYNPNSGKKQNIKQYITDRL